MRGWKKKTKMTLTAQLGLFLLCLSRTVEISHAGETVFRQHHGKKVWQKPPFSQPEPMDDVVCSFNYDSNERTNIELQEEVTHEVCIAVVNYDGDEKPSVGSLEEGKSNFVLGAVLRKNSTVSNKWSLWITKKQDYETPLMQTYRFPIIIGQSEYTIALNIMNIDDNPPSIQANERNCSIEENSPPGSANCTYVISDADGWIDQLKYSLTASPDDEVEHFELITSPVSGAFADRQLNAHLNVLASLDFETISMYSLLLRVVDGAGHEGTLTAVVEVIDMPDEPPRWTRITAAENILEKTSENFTVAAIDGDININAPINYRIVAENQREENFFVVDEKSGVITINPIDRDELQKEIFRFVVFAYEVPEPTSNINATIIVVVEDDNDNSPVIAPGALTIDIDEEKYTTLEFDPAIVISDPDLAENGQYSVSLVDDSKHNWSSAFLVVPTSGYQQGIFTISVSNATLIDYEDESWRNIKIQFLLPTLFSTAYIPSLPAGLGNSVVSIWNCEAHRPAEFQAYPEHINGAPPNIRNGLVLSLRAVEIANTSHIGTSTININLRNLNDELPIFDENTQAEVSVPEDVDIEHFIATIHATDRDVDDNVTHSLVAQRTLVIDEKSGDIVTSQKNALDYETMPIVVVQVVATDLASHKTYATLTINVIDVNDVPPQLNMPKEVPTLMEEEPDGTEVNAVITATDVDTDAELFFSIDWNNTRAHKASVPVDESHYRGRLGIRTVYPEKHKRYAEGILHVSGDKTIDYEAFDVMFLTISVTDNKTVHNEKTTSASMSLNIEDINDNSPKFNQIEPMRVIENQINGAMIGTITATDADGPKYNKVSYSVEPINKTTSSLISINDTTGVIRVDLDRGIDAEKYEYIYYDVTASDGENNTTEPIAIYVIDENDEEPELCDDKFNSTFRIPEKSPSGTTIVKICARDNDRTYPYNNVSYLINANYSAPMQYFSMGRFDGWLQVNLTGEHILDRDFGQSEFTLNLKLRDNYLVDDVTYNTNAIDTTVTVILDDINDCKPELPDKGEPAANVTENLKKGAHVLTVKAVDHDDNTTDNTKVFYEIHKISSANGTDVELGNDCDKLFVVETRDQREADIIVNCNLRGYYGRWIVDLYAQDLGVNPGPLNDTRSYVIQVTDFNYYDPVIEFPTSKRIALKAEQRLHETLRTYDDQPLNDFKATDKDHGDSGLVTFTLSSTTGDHEYFEIVKVPVGNNVGQLRLVKNLPEEKKTCEMTLTATDGGDPMRYVNQEFTLVFVSTLGPEFVKNELTVWIKENKTGLDYREPIPKAYDMISDDGDNTIAIYYFLMNEEDSDTKHFALNKVSRVLTVREELDREKQEIMIVHVVATTDKDGPPRNPQDAAVLKITVVVLDENDNPPIFDETDQYHAGVTMADALDKSILTVKATDADLNDTLTYSIAGDMTVTDFSLKVITKPFFLNPQTGEVLLKFTPTSDMKGFFKFDIMVHDAVNHSDSVVVNIYIVLEKNRVVFTFKNSASYVKDQRQFVIDSFNDAFGYVCNVDDIKSARGNDGQVLDNVTTLTTHFINPKDNLPISSDSIVLSSSDLQTITNLKATLLERSLNLVDVPTGSSSVTADMQQTVHWILVSLTTFFCLCSISMLVAFVVRTRRLTQRLDKLAITKYGSQESGLDKAGIVPGTNQFAIAGSNPMWNTNEKTVDDNVSQGSGDSDLIGVEDNPDFGYVNGAFATDGRWENGSVNPAFANHRPVYGGFRPDLSSVRTGNKGL